MKRLLILLAMLTVSACSTITTATGGAQLDGRAKWAMLPMVNHTDTPQAALAAESLIEHQARRRGVGHIARYPATLSRDSLFEPSERRVVDEARKWAKEQGAIYGITGTVEEWRYKVGIDGEPAVGVTLQVVDLRNDEVLWSASGARSGWSREALSGVANKLLASLMSGMPVSASQ
jgi:TolB-like protein